RCAEVRPDEGRLPEVHTEEVGLIEGRLAEVRTAEVGYAEVRPDEVCPAEVRLKEVRIAEVRLVEERLAEVWTDVGVLVTPRVPARPNSLLEYREMLVVHHGSTPEVLRRTSAAFPIAARAPRAATPPPRYPAG